MWTATFWKETAERAIKTAAQAFLAFFVVDSADLWSLDWRAVLSGVGVATIASVLTSIASEGIGPKGSPSIVAGEDA